MTPPHDRQAEVLRFIKQRLAGGVYAPGDRLPNRWDLEREVGVSRVTIQSAFDRLISEGFVVARGRAGTFVADRPPHLHCFGVVLMESVLDWRTWGGFNASIQNEALSWNQEEGATTFRVYTGVTPPVEGNDNYAALLDDVREHRVAGLILIAPTGVFLGADLFDIPLVPKVVIQNNPAEGFPTLTTDRVAFLNRALDTLAASGRRRIGGLVLAHTTTQEFFDAHIAAGVRSRGMETESHWWQMVAHVDQLSARNAAMILMKTREFTGIDGLIIEDDNLVDVATAGIAASGVVVPDEVHVVARANFPHVTTSHVPATRIGLHLRRILQQATELVTRQRQGRQVAHATRTLIADESYWMNEGLPVAPVGA